MDQECFICLEPNKVVNSRERTYYIKKFKYTFDCKCITYTHEKCMQKWISRTPKCPICRNQLHVCANWVYKFGEIIILLIRIFIVFYTVIYGVKYIFDSVHRDFDTRTCSMWIKWIQLEKAYKQKMIIDHILEWIPKSPTIWKRWLQVWLK